MKPVFFVSPSKDSKREKEKKSKTIHTMHNTFICVVSFVKDVHDFFSVVVFFRYCFGCCVFIVTADALLLLPLVMCFSIIFIVLYTQCKVFTTFGHMYWKSGTIPFC